MGNFNYSLYMPDIDLDIGKKIAKSKVPNKKFELKFPEKENIIQIFTDGSKITENGLSQVGFGIWCKNREYNYSHKIPDIASIYTAECKSLIYIVDKITDRNDCEFIIFSDSMSALLALENNSKKKSSPLIESLRQKLAHLSNSKVKIKLVWIPAHMGIMGNEIADINAKQGAISGELLDDPVPFSDLFAIIKEKYKKENENILINIGREKGILYFENFYTKANKPWFYNLNLSRKAVVSINRIRSGHTSLNSSLYRQKIVDTDRCKCGEDVDTIDHIFWRCKLYNSERDVMTKEIRKEYKRGPLSVINLLTSQNVKLLYNISDFIDKIDCNI